MAKIEAKAEIKTTKAVRCKVNCSGYGYEDFRANTERVLPIKLADLLINFGYVEEIK